ncbi:RNB domain-containing ribonuclease, partial [Acidobacteriota bacterium]
LPRRLVENEASLQEGQQRPAFTVSIPMNRRLEAGEPRLRRTMLTSLKRLTYAEADWLMRKDSAEHHHVLFECARIADTLLKRRRARGALAIFDLRRGLVTSEEGFLRSLGSKEAHVANLIVQEFMILANETVARHLASRHVSGLFRNHKASPAAPGHESILKDIENALACPEAFPLATLRERLHLVLGRADYGPTLEGHFGLNLPAYMHLTSPLRRYVDLINQRILCALAEGGDPPYAMEELARIAKHINATDREFKERRDERIKEKTVRRALRIAGHEGYSLLDDSQMHSILRIVLHEGAMSSELEQELLSRLERGGLPIQDIYLLLIEAAGAGKDWDGVRRKAYDWICTRSEHALSVLNMAYQALGAPPPSYDVRLTGSGHRPVFITSARFIHGDKEYVTSPYEASSKKRAQQHGALELVARLAGFPFGNLRDMFERKTPGSSETKPSSVRHALWPAQGGALTPIEMLNNLCQGKKWGLPAYTTTISGQGDQLTFTTSVQVVIGERQYTSDPCSAAGKKASEQLAALR